MKKVFSLFKHAPKRMTAAILMLAAAIIIPAASFAWGPDRPTYTVNNPADHITFNSMTDNPEVGDERDFVVAKDASNTNAAWSNDVSVQPGHEYIIRIYAHNNAASSLNLTAINTRVSASVPTTTGTTVPVSGFVSADNATPKQVWDDVNFTTGTNGQQFNLAYVPGSAQIYNNGYAQNGANLPDSIVTSSGALIGYNGPDGKVPGCFQYANYIYIKVKPQFATTTTNFTINKQVRENGTSTFVNSLTANPGDTLNYRLTFANTGTAELNNVNLKDTLPAGISEVPGSVQIMNANNPNGAYVQNGDSLFTSSGINIGSYTGGSNAIVVFNAKVASADALTCGVNTLTNQIVAQPEGQGSKSATAPVTVNKQCTTPTPTYTCNALTSSLVSDTTYKFSGSATAANGATITGYSLDFGDGSAPYTGTSVSNVSHTYPTTGGTYTARLTADVSVNGSNTTVTSDSCATTITIKTTTPPTPTYTCDTLTASLVSDSTYRFDGSASAANGATITGYTLDFGDGSTPYTGSAVSNVTHQYAQTGSTYTARLTANVSVNDSNKTVTSDACTVKITVGQPPVTPPTTPSTPTELPHTGMSSTETSIVGLGAIVLSLGYYVASRRAAMGR